jgi:iron complex outermembrane recepter protein
MRQFKRTTISLAVAQMAMLGAGVVHAQTTPAAPATEMQTVVVTGQRKALQSAQKLKQDAEEIIDSVVAEEAGKLPDKSITEVLQRMVGVTIDRNKSRGDPEHFSVEGSGISIRGLSWGASNLNGRESFSAGWPGRELSWGDIPPELMAAVDVHKNPSAELIEGGISGLVNLRTWLPFDFKGTKGYVSLGNNYVEVSKKSSPSVSGLFTTQWEAESGRWGVLVDLAQNRSTFENQSLQLDAYYPRTDLVPNQTVWAPKSASWRTNTGETDRSGAYAALQWRKNDMQSSLTYFLSATREKSTETGIYTGVEDAYKSVIDNPTYDANGVLQSGTYRYLVGRGANDFEAGGLNFNTSRGYGEGQSKTQELAWNFKWEINDRWSFQNDLQWVHASHKSFNRNLQMGTFVPSMTIDASGKDPVRIGFDQAGRDFLANPANYYWNVIMPSKSKGEGDLYAWKADGKFRFEDPVLRDLRFGVRSTYRKATKWDASYVSDPAADGTWRSIAEPWAVKTTSTPGQLPSATDPEGWQPRATFAYLRDPRYQMPTELYNYGNFYRGRVGTLPNIVFPTFDVVKDFPNTYTKLMSDVRYQQCLDAAQTYGRPAGSCNPADFAFDANLIYGGAPAKTSSHSESTNAVYGTLRFGFDDWKFPVEGNAGLRVVHSKRVSHGHETFQPSYSATTPPDLPRFAPVSAPRDVSHNHLDALPSLNLKVNVTQRLQARIAMARAINRPGFDQLGETIKLAQNFDVANNTVTYTGENTGNVKLKPIKADSFDVSLEWYPRDGQSLTAVVFYKDIQDIIMKTMYTRTYNSVGGNPQTFSITGPENAAKARVKGFEIAGMTYLDRVPFLKDELPVWSKGFGVSANYTYIDGKQKLYRDIVSPYCDAGSATTNAGLKLYGCDTNGVPFHDLPLPYMAKHAFNFALMYDQGPLSARLAYNWHSRILQGIDVNGTRGSDATSADPARPGARDVGWGLPTWQEGFGQWDAGVSYKINDQFSMSLSVTNLNDVTVRQTQQQHIGNMGRAWFYPGRSYNLNARYEF